MRPPLLFAALFITLMLVYRALVDVVDIGVIYAKQARFGEAVSAFETVVKMNPRDVAAHTNLGNAYSLQGRFAEAKEELERALKIKPDYLAARQALESLSP